MLFYAAAVLTFLQAYNAYCAVRWLDAAGASTQETRATKAMKAMKASRAGKAAKTPKATPTLSPAAARAARAARVRTELDLLALRTTVLQTRLRRHEAELELRAREGLDSGDRDWEG